MIHRALKLSRLANTIAIPTRLGLISVHSRSPSPSPAVRLLHDGTDVLAVKPVALQMTDYAFSHARSQKSDESYAQGLLILEQCLSTQSGDSHDTDSQNSKGMVLLAMATLLADRGNFNEAMEKLQMVQGLTQSSLAVRVAATEALVGLNLELGHVYLRSSRPGSLVHRDVYFLPDDTSSVLADKCLELFDKDEPRGSAGGYLAVEARAKAVKGLVEHVRGNLEPVKSCFQAFLVVEDSAGSSAALSYGEFLHGTRNFSLAKELYQNVIQSVGGNKGFGNICTLAACNMAPDEVLLAATCALGQLEAHTGNFDDAEEILTRALTKTEEQYGTCHPKVGVVLTCLALMFRSKAKQEHSSALLIQEGLYRRAIELLKALPLESEETMGSRRDIVALARGGYAQALSVQQNRKNEGGKMKRWAESAWGSHRMSLAEALDLSESSGKVPIIDVRISRVL
ncbi:Tetratricopeptide repeat (TPR)-like superfamily protein putative isoform 1 [Tripterygium wilfordii]|uniref:Tetratricopeptide repeat (TPR)-like superfamily protein putative isoform 1 n=1 Tax=Tripterygium wilfordii TaxID=458696 RepID=A0A7J7DML3_TRIWF|nr:Tetratricopeptide repeat (TPR)-like superfamily protein putative isoform 1 [Tripterygium wilfordii]